MSSLLNFKQTQMKRQPRRRRSVSSDPAADNMLEAKWKKLPNGSYEAPVLWKNE